MGCRERPASVSDRRRLVICGAGMAGLTAALAAERAGWQPIVLERAEMLSEVGAGLQIGANAMKVLAKLGLDAAVEAAGHVPERLEMREGATGRILFAVPAGETGRTRWGGAHVNIRRAALQDILAAALEERVPGALRLGREAVDYRSDRAGVRVALVDGSQVTGDALIGADGIHSALRARFTDGTRPRYTGHTALRVLVPADGRLRTLVPDASIAWTGPGRHAVTYFLAGRALINFVGVIEQAEPAPEGWHNAASLERACDAFAGFAAPVRAILEAAEGARGWGLYDRPPPDTLQAGRVALVGDAAAPMPPFLAQGASFAMECAWVAVWSLAQTGGFLAYERAMRLRAARILEAARRNGRLFHGHGLPVLAGYGPVRLAARFAPAFITGRFDWIYGYDATAGRALAPGG